MAETPPPPPDETVPAARAQVPGQPSAEPSVPTNELRPGAGQPLVQGPPASVGPPVSAGLFNLAGGIGCIALGAAALIVLVVLLVVLFKIL